MGELNYTNEQKRCLARIASMSYTMGNYLPQEVIWTFNASTIIKIVEEKVRSHNIEDFYEITLGRAPFTYQDTETGENRTDKIPAAFIWLPRNSDHLVDKRLQNTNSYIKTPIPSYSDTLKKFAATFGVGGKLKHVSGQGVGLEDGKRTTGKRGDAIVTDLMRFMAVELDINGTEYGKLFGNEFKERLVMQLVDIDLRRVDGGDPNDKEIREITISLSRPRKTKKQMRPKISFNMY